MPAGDWLLRRALSESGLAGGGDGSDRWPSCRSPAGAMWSADRGRAAGPALLGLLLALSLSGGRAAKTDAGLVTCGSVLKLFNTQHRVRLHSHDIKYGSGARPGPPDGGLGAGSPWARGLGVLRAGGRRFRGRGRDAVRSGGPRSATRGGRGPGSGLWSRWVPGSRPSGKRRLSGATVGVATLTATPGMGCRPQAAASSR